MTSPYQDCTAHREMSEIGYSPLGAPWRMCLAADPQGPPLNQSFPQRNLITHSGDCQRFAGDSAAQRRLVAIAAILEGLAGARIVGNRHNLHVGKLIRQLSS